MRQFDTVLRGGNLVLPDKGLVAGDIAITDGRIAAIAAPNSGLRASETFDCHGRWVMPGLIDPHVHFGFGQPDCDFLTESRSAALGGVTSVLSFLRQNDFLEEFENERQRAESQSCIDFGYHFGITSRRHVETMPECLERFGVSSFKFYLMYKGEFGRAKGFTEIDDGLLFYAMEQVARLPGAVLSVHCENVEVVGHLRARLKAQAREGLPAWDDQSPDFLEAENVNRVCYFAGITGCPVNIVHISSAEALREVRRHRALAQVPIHVETCTHYLFLTRDSKAGELGKVNPPLRSDVDRDALWKAIADGTIDTVGDDHIPRKRATKEGGIWKASAGFPGIATMLPIMIHEGFHRRGIPVERLSAVLSTNVAKLYNIPNKGDIAIGFDADLVVVDPDRETTVDPSKLESNSDYSPYEGETLTGTPLLTLVRGKVVAREGEVVGVPGSGTYLARRPERGGSA